MKHLFDIDPADWPRLRALLDSGMAVAPGAREGWLARLGPDHQPLVVHLRALLAHHRAGDAVNVLDTLPRIETREFASGDPDSAAGADTAPGTEVGPYRLQRLLGEGGAGSVWLAQRADGQLQRPVALKLPRLLAERKSLAERLARERDFLAVLDHPHIARLYDAGLADGRPYIALEYVEGRHIDAYCDQQKLDIRARLALFVQVADAVAHAHGKLIVHRDLKPANILVTAQGQVRLLDFGIAKLVENDVAGATELTQAGGRALTPAYASPEQVAGQPLGTATDIYSLGVVLYQLLAGRPPYTPRRRSRAALEEAILHADPAPPSAMAADPRWRKTLRGDLDTIVLKALKKTPAERYATVNAFADDVGRWLARRPVLAQPDSLWYRVRKFAVRNRIGVGVGATLALVIVGAAGAALWQASVARQEQRRAERVKSYIASIFADANPYAARSGTATTGIELLNHARARIDQELTREPEVRAELLNVLGASYAGLFALTDAEVVLAQAIAATAALPDQRERALRLAAIEVDLGQVKKLLGKTDEGSALVDSALARLTEPGQRHSDVYADARILQGGLALNRGDYATLIAAAEEGIAVATQLHGPLNERVANGYILISKIRTTSDAERRRMLDAARQGYEIMRALQGDQPTPHPRLIEAQHDYGNGLLFAGEYRAAEQHIMQSLADARTLFGPLHIMVGHFTVRAGYLHLLQGRLEAGVREVRTGLDTLAKVDPSRGVAAAVNHRTLALGLLALHRPAEAIAALDTSLAILAQLNDRRAPVIFKGDHAMALLEAGQLRRAAEVLAPLDAEGATLQPPARPLRAIGRLELARGRFDAAREVLQLALAADEKDIRKPYRAEILIDLGRVALEQGDDAGAAARAEAALADLERTAVAVTPNHAAAWTLLAAAKVTQLPEAEVLALLQRADDLWRSMNIADRWAGETAFTLAQVHRANGRRAQAESAATRAEKAFATAPHPGDARRLAQLRAR